MLPPAVRQRKTSTTAGRPSRVRGHGPQHVPQVLDEAIGLLRASGGRFAFLFGSQVNGPVHRGSDVDVAVWIDGDADELLLRSQLPAGVDLLVLDGAPLELASRVALHGRLLFDDDPALRG